MHHTIPLMIARMLRYDDHMDDVVGAVEEISLERVENMEEEVTNLVAHRAALDYVFQMMGTEIEQTMDTVAESGHRLDAQSYEIQELREILMTTRQRLENQARELAAARATIHTLGVALEEVRARERAREWESLELLRMVRDLERRSGGTSGAQ